MRRRTWPRPTWRRNPAGNLDHLTCGRFTACGHVVNPKLMGPGGTRAKCLACQRHPDARNPSKKKSPGMLSMFGVTDLPLFSGTAQKGHDAPFKPAERVRQGQFKGMDPDYTYVRAHMRKKK